MLTCEHCKLPIRYSKQIKRWYHDNTKMAMCHKGDTVAGPKVNNGS